MYVEIEIPPQFVEPLLQYADENGVSADEAAESMIKNYLERMKENA